MAPTTVTEANGLLQVAFPLGATVSCGDGSRFLSLAFAAVEGTADNDRIVVSFEGKPGDATGSVTRAQLQESSRTGRLAMDNSLVRRPEAADSDLLSKPFGALIGWQAQSDDQWAARMRLHQSWWRTFRLRVPFGSGPNAGSIRRYGNMLDAEAVDAGMNFLSADAAASYDTRVAQNVQGVDPWRTKRNLLASQPLAFNLFGHLSRHLDLATALFDELLGDVAEVTGGEIERISSALGDRTAFDAFFTYQRADQTPGCIAIETKLTEPFSQHAYDWDYYRSHPAFSSAIWNTDDTNLLGDRRWSQLWRNHLLAVAESRADPELGEPTTLVVHHRSDPHCATNVDWYRALLHHSDSCRAITLDDIDGILRPLVDGRPADQRWLERFEERYLRLELSKPLTALLNPHET